MIILDNTNKSLELVLVGAITTNQLPFVISYIDVTTTLYTPIEADGVSNSTTAVTMAAAPAASTQRQIKYLSIQNQDTASATAIIRYNDNTTIRQIVKILLAVNDTLFYTDGEGFRVMDTNGCIKTVGTITGAALTRVDDTNVTLTLGGTPTLALLQATSLTLGWTGTLADGRIASASNWNTAYTNRITSLTVTGSSGASTLISNVLNIPTYTLSGLGGTTLAAVNAQNLSVFAATTSTQLRGVLSDENGSGVAIFDSNTSQTLITPILGTPTSGNLANCTFPTLNQNTTGYAAALKSATTTVDVSAATAPTVGQVLTATDSTHATWQAAAAGGANTALSYLASVSINTSLLAQTGVDLGGTANPFRNLYLFGAGTYGTTYFKLTGTPTSTRTITVPDVTSTMAVVGTNNNFSTAQTVSGTILGWSVYINSNGNGQYFNVGGSAGNLTYKLTNAGGAVTPSVAFHASNVASGVLSYEFDATNGLVLSAGNASSVYIARASVQLINLTNTSGSEAGDMILLTQSGGTAMSQKMRISGLGNIVLGAESALATNATDGATYLPSMAGSPSGVATSYTGKVPMVIDTTNSKIWCYIGGAWKGIILV